MSKTPYEIRLELLHIAQGIVNEQMMNERIRLENDWNMEREKVEKKLSMGDVLVELPAFPVIPNIDAETVIKVAEKLNGFVSNNGEVKNA